VIIRVPAIDQRSSTVILTKTDPDLDISSDVTLTKPPNTILPTCPPHTLNMTPRMIFLLQELMGLLVHSPTVSFSSFIRYLSQQNYRSLLAVSSSEQPL
jgi:hypothetical protein